MDNVFSNLAKERELKRLNGIAVKVEILAKHLENLSEEQFLAKTADFKKRLQAGENINNMLPEAYALVSSAIQRKFGFKPHRVQLMGAISIFEGTGVEMRTGEGKTITAIFPAYLNALKGEPVHIMTSNDYLAERDAETVQPVFDLLGMSVGSINSSLSRADKKKIYQSDIVYGTTSNFGFDFLRDNLAYKPEHKFTRGLGFAIVDEADSLLLDQARTPLILSESEKLSEQENELFRLAAKFASELTTEDVEIDAERKVATLANSGVDKAEKFFDVNFDVLFDKYLFYINSAVTAKYALEKDVDYIVSNGRVVLIDQNTARPLPTHRFAEGLHQSVEAKENLEIRPESKVLGRITIQNFLRKYNKISGMSGTIKTSEEELQTIYGLDVVQIPTNKPVQRKDDTKFYFYGAEKYEAIVRDILETHQKGQPVLIGTISIEESELIKGMLDRIGIKCSILNAKNLSEEAKIVANAGRFGAVTIATDMAGRGTDIKLGGNADVLAEIEARSGKEVDFDKIKRETKENKEKVIAAGGLKVIGASLHGLVRVDDQLRGRSGRQGEVGETVFYTSLEDAIFEGQPEVQSALRNDFIRYMSTKDEKVKEKIKEKILEKFEKIQAINESIDFEARKSMVIYDREVSVQYEEFYKLRNEILESNDISPIIANGANYLAESIIDCAIEYSSYGKHKPERENENYSKYKSVYDRFFFNDISFNSMKKVNREEMVKKLSNKIMDTFNINTLNGAGKTILLKNMDEAFMNHLKEVEMLKKNVPFMAYGESNPLRAFEEQSHIMYMDMINNILPEMIMELIEKTPKPFQFGKFTVPNISQQQSSTPSKDL